MIEREREPNRLIRLGTRGSALALAQADLVIARIQETLPGVQPAVHVVRTEGDADRASPLSEIGGRGVFTNALEQAILGGEIDVAVHSAKDLPTTLHPRVPIVAIPDRVDPRDVLISRHQVGLVALPPNPVIGTSSRRRAVQIRQLRPDARIANIRGNIDTRLRKAQGPEFDGIVVAAAGLLRMGLPEQVAEVFDVEQMVPSPGQGALAIQAMAGSSVGALVASIDDPCVSRPVRTERAFLAAIGAGCSVPVGAFVRQRGDVFTLVAMLADPDGDRVLRVEEDLSPGEESLHAAEIATRMQNDLGGASSPRLWPNSTQYGPDLRGARVVVTRPLKQAGRLIEALSKRGAEPVSLPAIRVEPVTETSELDAALVAAVQGEFDWLAFTSANAVNVVAHRLGELDFDSQQVARLKVAVVGTSTAAAAQEAGFAVRLIADTANAEHLAWELLARVEAGARVLYPRSATGRDALPFALREAGIDIAIVDAYQTVPESKADPAILERMRRCEIDVITFTSPSTVYGLLTLLGDDGSAVKAVPVVCTGPVTAEAARVSGFPIVAVSADPGAEAIADAVAAHWSGRLVPMEAGTRRRSE